MIIQKDDAHGSASVAEGRTPGATLKELRAML